MASAQAQPQQLSDHNHYSTDELRKEIEVNPEAKKKNLRESINEIMEQDNQHHSRRKTNGDRHKKADASPQDDVDIGDRVKKTNYSVQ